MATAVNLLRGCHRNASRQQPSGRWPQHARSRRGRSELRHRPQVPSIALKTRNVPGGHGMTRSKSKVSTSRRRLIKAALAGIVAPAVPAHRHGVRRLSRPPGPDRRGQHTGRTIDIIARIMAAAMQEAMRRSRSSWRTRVAAAAISAWAMSRAPMPTATPSCSRPAPIRSIPASTTPRHTIRSRISPPYASLRSRPTCSR